jgi:predicted Zn-dependent protease
MNVQTAPIATDGFRCAQPLEDDGFRCAQPILRALVVCAIAVASFSAPAADLDKFQDLLGGVREKAGAAKPFLPVSEADEIATGEEVAARLLGTAPLVADDALQRYVNSVGRWVALASERPDLPWRFGVIATDDINAFACPGGIVLITKGLYRTLATESELAGVLGHEISHVVARDHINVMRKQAGIQLGSEVLGKKLEGGKSEVVKNLVGNGAEIFARSLDKDAEFAADRSGVVLAARAGYEPYGLPAVLNTLTTIKPGSDAVALLFKTHPAPAQRLERLGAAMDDRLASYEKGRTGALRALK